MDISVFIIHLTFVIWHVQSVRMYACCSRLTTADNTPGMFTRYTSFCVSKRKNHLEQWFLTWVRSNPRGSLSHSQGFGRGQDTHSIARFTLAMSGRFYIYLCFEEIIFYFSNYEGFGECTDEARRVQYLQ